ncbi:MAG: AAA family ATPase [Cyclobacteriaceae bacterium]
MKSNHFSYFRVKNFKRFKDLEVKDIDQFNLVLGDNNVGKTSLLEALMVGNNPYHFVDKLAKNYYAKKHNRGGLFAIIDFYMNKGADENFITLISCSLETDKEDIYNLRLSPTENHLEILPSESGNIIELAYNTQVGDLPHIKSNLINAFETDLIAIEELYALKIQRDRSLRSKLVDGLGKLVDSISGLDITVVGNVPSFLVETYNSNYLVSLSAYGSGTQKCFEILVKTVHFSSNRLMIDEIDAGIHYSRMKDYWKVILQSAQENNVQIFATTHNRECIESYKSALMELGEDFQHKSRTITLKESPKDKSIKAYTNQYEVLEDALAVGNDLR